LANDWTALAAPNASATFATAAIASQGETALVMSGSGGRPARQRRGTSS
jgi:hypothetical protein